MKMTVGSPKHRGRGLAEGVRTPVREERERDADGDDAEREAIAHEGDDRERQDHERCDDGVHGVSVAAALSWGLADAG